MINVAQLTVSLLLILTVARLGLPTDHDTTLLKLMFKLLIIGF
jgi:hypothetical protein